jgi:hypothetical protein
MNFGALLKMLGIKVPPETVAQIEVILPQLPAKIQGVIGLVNLAVQNFDARLRSMEQSQAAQLAILVKILEEFENGRNDSDSEFRPAGTGLNGRSIAGPGAD